MKNKASQSGVVWLVGCLLMLAIWSVPKAEAQSAVRLKPVLQLGYGQAQDSAWSPIGDAFAVSSSSGLWVYSAWDQPPVQLVPKPIDAFFWSNNGQFILTLSATETVVWTVRDGTAISLDRGGMKTAAWNADDTVIALSDASNRIWTWLPQTGRTFRLTPRTAPTDILSLAWRAPCTQPCLLSLDASGTLKQWDASTESESVALQVPQALRSPLIENFLRIAWNANRTQVALAPTDTLVNKLYVFNVDNGALDAEAESNIPLGKWLRSLDWSADGTTLAAMDDQETIWLWDAQTLKPLRNFGLPSGNDAAVANVTWHRDSQRLLMNTPGMVVIWDSLTAKPLARFAEFMTAANAVAWSADGARIATAHGASGTADYRIRLWDFPSGRLRCVLEGHRSSVNDVSWSPDGRNLVSGAGRLDRDDQMVRLWDATTCKEAGRAETMQIGIFTAQWSPDGRYIAVPIAGAMLVWSADLQGKPQVFTNTLGGTLAWSPDSTKILSAAGLDFALIFDITGSSPEVKLPSRQRITALSWRADGKQVATGGGIPQPSQTPTAPSSGALDYGVQLWDAASGALLATLAGHTDWVYALSWQTNGTLLASASADGQVIIWDTDAYQPVGKMVTDGSAVRAVDWRADGKHLIVSTAANTVLILAYP
ncbi:MAG: hypothetical protein DYG88_05390 [Chloroflexi bacterium CFX4]|nr:hypothetical protein [Chloroflexi bacterium CFX4]MDL1923988.1 hypothetical protein [Chloroflexi bacterium CFX3]